MNRWIRPLHRICVHEVVDQLPCIALGLDVAVTVHDFSFKTRSFRGDRFEKLEQMRILHVEMIQSTCSNNEYNSALKYMVWATLSGVSLGAEQTKPEATGVFSPQVQGTLLLLTCRRIRTHSLSCTQTRTY